MGLTAWMTLILFALKLTGYLHISWWLVFAPFAAGVAVFVTIGIVGAVLGAIFV